MCYWIPSLRMQVQVFGCILLPILNSLYMCYFAFSLLTNWCFGSQPNKGEAISCRPDG